MEALAYLSLVAAVLAGLAIIVRPFWGVLALTLVLPFVNRLIPKGPYGLNAETILFSLALFAVLLFARPALPRLRLLAPFIAYCACVLFSFGLLLVSGDFILSRADLLQLAQTMKSNLWPILLFFVGYALAVDPKTRDRLLICMVGGLLVFSISGLLDFLWSDSPRAAGPLAENPNILGGHLAAFSVIALSLLFGRDRSRSLRAFCALAYGMAFLVLILTQSRSSWVAFLSAHAVWLLYTNRRLLAPAAAAFLILFSIGYSLSWLPQVVSQRIDYTLTPGNAVYRGGALSGRFDSSVDVRLALYRMGADMFVDSPIWGHGFRTYRLLSRKYGARYGFWGVQEVSSESILLTVAVNSGLIGLAVLGWLFWALLSRARALARARQAESPLGGLFLAVLGAVVVLSLSQNALFNHEIALFFWLFAGLVMRAHADRGTSVASLSPVEVDRVDPRLLNGYPPQLEAAP